MPTWADIGLAYTRRPNSHAHKRHNVSSLIEPLGIPSTDPYRNRMFRRHMNTRTYRPHNRSLHPSEECTAYCTRRNGPGPPRDLFHTYHPYCNRPWMVHTRLRPPQRCPSYCCLMRLHPALPHRKDLPRRNCAPSVYIHPSLPHKRRCTMRSKEDDDAWETSRSVEIESSVQESSKIWEDEIRRSSTRASRG